MLYYCIVFVVSSSIIETVYNMSELKSCPIETTFRIIGKRWIVLIIREILRGNTQFNRFMENIEGISPKVLTQRLRELDSLESLVGESYPSIQSWYNIV